MRDRFLLHFKLCRSKAPSYTFGNIYQTVKEGNTTERGGDWTVSDRKGTSSPATEEEGAGKVRRNTYP